MMNTQLRPVRVSLIAAATLLSLASPLSADMTLDASTSSVSLLSTKVLAGGTQSVVERHAFTSIEGMVADDGMATVTIMLDSIETNIPIRNERMAEFLFETGQYPDATITAQVPAEYLVEGTHTGLLGAQLSLHGETQALSIPVNVHSTGQRVVVTASEPVMLDASAYKLDAGIGKLQDLAKLLHIPTMVPVSFSLTFSQSDS